MSDSASDEEGNVPSEAIDLAHRGGLDWIPLYLDTIYKYFVDTYEKYNRNQKNQNWVLSFYDSD